MEIKEIDVTGRLNQLVKSLERFTVTKILVLGDIILDAYIWGEVNRISPEAPVPVVEVERETTMPGGAANVVLNIVSLGGQSIICGVVGDDRTGRIIFDQFRSFKTVTNSMIIDPERPTSIKTRVIAQNQQVVRFDRESVHELGAEAVQKLLDKIYGHLDGIHAIVVTDYGKGVVSPEMIKGIRALTEDSEILLAVDPKVDHFEYYRGVDIITPNHHEAGAFCGFKISDKSRLIDAGRLMLDRLRCRAVLITQGKDGMTLFESNGEISHIPTRARKVFDVTGAGDTVISTLSLGLASGMDFKDAAYLSNLAAGLVVGEVGTSTAKSEDLIKAIMGHAS